MNSVEVDANQNLRNINFFRFEYKNHLKTIKISAIFIALIVIYLLSYGFLITDDKEITFTITIVRLYLMSMFFLIYLFAGPYTVKKKIYNQFLYFYIWQISFVILSSAVIYWVFSSRILFFAEILYSLSFANQISIIIIINFLIFHAAWANFSILRALNIESSKNYYHLESLQKEVNIWQQQISPHFVGNALSNLNGLIRAGENEKAIIYNSQLITLFIKQMKFADFESITIEDEIDWISIYLEVEKKRVPYHFQYQINVENPDINLQQIPPMLLQPLLENSLIHGFNTQIDKEWQININFCELDTNTISIEIADNGVGKNCSQSKSKKSISQNNISKRIELLNSIGKFEVNFKQSFTENGANNCLLIKTNNN